MKKGYSLVNITKAKDQEAVQSICIKVSLLLFWNCCYSHYGQSFSAFFWRAESGLHVELDRGKYKVDF